MKVQCLGRKGRALSEMAIFAPSKIVLLHYEKTLTSSFLLLYAEMGVDIACRGAVSNRVNQISE